LKKEIIIIVLALGVTSYIWYKHNQDEKRRKLKEKIGKKAMDRIKENIKK
jgi:hypothetical protein